MEEVEVGGGSEYADVSPSLKNTSKSIKKADNTQEYVCAAAVPNPGPADYSPDVAPTKYHDPEYSFGTKTKSLKGLVTPSPLEYDVGTTMGSGHATQLAEKLDTWPLGLRKDIHLTDSPGPAYQLPSTLANTPALTFGLNNKLAPFSTPAPNAYEIKADDRGPGWSLRVKTSPKSFETRPSPADLYVDVSAVKPRQPAASMHIRTLPLQKDDFPGPGDYLVPSTLNTKSLIASMKSRYAQFKAETSPSPANYYVPASVGVAPAVGIKFRDLPRTIPDLSPDPTSYTPNESSVKPRQVEYTIRPRTKATFPESLQYQTGDVPAASAFDVSAVKPKDPAFSMRKKTDLKPFNTPGPGAYNVEHGTMSGAKKSPAYSFGIAFKATKSNGIPAPSQYTPLNGALNPSHAKSLGVRPPTRSGDDFPGPQYNIPPALSTTAKSFGGKHSEYEYSGVKTIIA